MGTLSVLLLTYAEWFFGTFEAQALYPLDPDRAEPIAGMTEVVVMATDGTPLVTWQATPAPGRPTVLYLPGNAGNLGARAARFYDLMGAGYGIVALSWRGSGGSGGKPSEETLPADALMIFDTACAGHCVVYGESLGAAVAVKIAATRDVSGVVLESPFTSIADLARVQFPTEDLTDYITQHWDSLALIPTVTEPLMVFHGAQDALVPFTQGEAIYAGAASTEKSLQRLEGRGHQSLWGPELTESLFGFIDAHASPG